MRLTVLGCAGSFPSASSCCSSYLVEHEDFRIVLDAGNGAVSALQKAGILHDVDAVYLSHLHADHCIDMTVWSVARRYDPYQQHPPLPVYGPELTGSRLSAAYAWPQEGPALTCFDMHTVTAGVFEVGPFRMETVRTPHPVETYAVRLTAGGRSLTYSADTGPSDDLVHLARDTDVALFEGSFHEGETNPPELHLTGFEAGQHARKAGADRLVLTHLVAWQNGEPDVSRSLTEAVEGFGDGVVVARAGLVLEV